MSLPPIDSVTRFLYQYPHVKEYLLQKEVDLQQIENIVMDVHAIPMLQAGISIIDKATVTLTMRNQQRQYFTATHGEARKLVSLRTACA